MATNRKMCYACGRFFTSDTRPNYCPYCGDSWHCDNIVLNAPPPMFPETSITCWTCGSVFSIENTNDLQFCVACKTCIGYSVNPYTSLKEWQLKVLKELGI